MRKILSTTTIILCAVLTASADIRTASEAESIARQFMQGNSSSAKGSIRLIRQMPESDSLYVFANAEGRSVFVSGSTLLNPVLGYTDEPIDADTELPANFAAWMQYAKDAVAKVEARPSLSIVGKQATASTPVISPLLGDIEWDQSSPWNDQCPLLNGQRTYVGCVATALSQIMYYYRYAIGKGSTDYTDDSNNHIAVDFASQTYDFSKMGATPRSTTDKSELAKFCFHVGAASQMSYNGSEGSGAYNWNATNGAIQHFSYSDLATCVERACFTYSEWNARLLNELVNGRPILYAGYSPDAGHAFVLDGIDAEGCYHVNWGWGGGYNGHYDVNLLAPGGYGIGATESAMDGFKDEQYATFNLAPALTEGEAGVEYLCGILSAGMGTEDATVAIGQTIQIVEYGIFDYRFPIDGNGTYGILVQQDGRDVKEIPVGTTQFDDYGYGLAFVNETGDKETAQSFMYVPFTVPSDLAEGTYQVYIYFRPQGRTDRRDIIRSYAYCPSYVTMTIADGKATFVDAWPWDYDVTASAWSSDESSASYTRAKTYDYAVTVNIGDEDLYGQFSLVWNEGGHMQEKTFGEAVYKAGSSTTLQTSYKPKYAGRAQCALYFSPLDVNVPEDYGNKIYFVASSAPYEVMGISGTDGSALRLTKSPYLAAGTPAIHSEVTFAVPVKNNGDTDYTGEFMLQFCLDGDDSGNAVFDLSAQVTVAADTKDTVYITGLLTDALVPGNSYVGSVYYLGNNDYHKLIPTGLRILNKVTIKPSQASGIESITDSEYKADAQSYNLQGLPVAKGHKGFIIQGGKIKVQAPQAP